MPCPPSLLDPMPADAPPIPTDVAVIGAGAAGAAAAWHLARRGLTVTLLERRPAGVVWRAAGPVTWADTGLSSRLASAAARLWRQVEQATGAALLHVVDGVRQVRADQATAALTAAATAWGAQLRHCDEVVAIDGAAIDRGAGGALVRTRTATLSAARVVLTGTGPAALAAAPAAPVTPLAAPGCFAVPALTAAVGEIGLTDHSGRL